jgi:hypothetical protein
LRSIVDLTQQRNTPAPQRTIPLAEERRRPEDAIRLESLEALANCDNYYLREAGMKIFAERFVANPVAVQRVLRDVNSEDQDIRWRASIACDLLTERGLLKRRDSGPDLHERPMFQFFSAGTGSNNGALSERERRRRRREAVVVHEGNHPVSQRDIYMPGGQSSLSMEPRR